MSDNIIKNPTRGLTHLPKSYEPEYLRLGKEPTLMGSPASSELPPSIDSVDGIGIDEAGNDIVVESGHIIDNNDYVDFGPFNPPKTIPNPSPPASILPKNNSTPNVGEYILMVLGKIIMSGSLDKIEEKVRTIIYGDDKDFAGLDINIEDVVVLKRIAIKVGIFLGD